MDLAVAVLLAPMRSREVGTELRDPAHPAAAAAVGSLAFGHLPLRRTRGTSVARIGRRTRPP